MTVPRRTQEARRTETIGKLLAATTASLVEDGYAGTSAKTICARAELSQGGLFRHFATIDLLLAATAEHVGTAMLASYRRRATRGAPDLAGALWLLREHCRSRDNLAWYELCVAARTRPPLKKALRPVAARYYAAIGALAREVMPELAAALGDRFPIVVDLAVSAFDGDALHRMIGGFGESPALDDARLAVLAALAR